MHSGLPICFWNILCLFILLRIHLETIAAENQSVHPMVWILMALALIGRKLQVGHFLSIRLDPYSIKF